MRITTQIIVVVMALALTEVAAQAASVRNWKPTNDKSPVKATFQSLRGGRVYLKRADDGTTIRIYLKNLSKADQDYIANLEKGKVKTPDANAWYATRGFERFNEMLGEFMLKAGQSHDFLIVPKGKDKLFVGFKAKEGEALEKAFPPPDLADLDKPLKPGPIELVSHGARNDPLSASMGVGMEFATRAGKLNFTITNHSKFDTRIVIHTRKGEKQGATFRLLGGKTGTPAATNPKPKTDLRTGAARIAGKKIKLPRDTIKWNGHSYKFFQERISWTDAKKKCEALGGHLVTIESAKENAHVTKLGASMMAPGKGGVWIGCTNSNEDGAWKWVTGEPLSFKYWTKGRPRRNKQNKYGVMYKQPDAREGKWSDGLIRGGDGRGKAYICEWDF